MKTPRMVSTRIVFAVAASLTMLNSATAACKDYEVPTLVQPAPCNCECDAAFDAALNAALSDYKLAFCACPKLPIGFECRAAALEAFYLDLDIILTNFADCVDSVPVPGAESQIAVVLQLIALFEAGWL